jgi:hypothetical protein
MCPRDETSMLHAVLDFISSVAFAVAATFGINMGIERPHYDVIERIGDAVEIRQYQKRIAAETTVEANKSNNPRSEAFRAVAGYIFGANKGRQKIDMTAPVEISSSGDKIVMTTPVEVKSSDSGLVRDQQLACQRHDMRGDGASAVRCQYHWASALSQTETCANFWVLAPADGSPTAYSLLGPRHIQLGSL